GSVRQVGARRRHPCRPRSARVHRRDPPGVGPRRVPGPPGVRSQEVQGMAADGQAAELWDPRGLGAASLVTYARRTYNVPMAIEQAREFRQRVITEVYPEWADYLAEDSMAILASSLGTTVNECSGALDWKGDRSPGLVWAVRRVVRGELNRRD